MVVPNNWHLKSFNMISDANRIPDAARAKTEDLCPLCGSRVTYRGLTDVECAGFRVGEDELPCRNYVATVVAPVSGAALYMTWYEACMARALGSVVEWGFAGSELVENAGWWQVDPTSQAESEWVDNLGTPVVWRRKP